MENTKTRLKRIKRVTLSLPLLLTSLVVIATIIPSTVRLKKVKVVPDKKKVAEAEASARK